MEIGRELRKRARGVIGPALGFFAVAYFTYHVIHGDRGLLAWRFLDEQVAAARGELQAAKDRRQALERRVASMRSSGIDPDLLDQMVRQVLGYGHPDDLIIGLSRDGTR